LGITVGIAPAPPAPFIPPERFGQLAAGLILVWTGDPGSGPEAMAPLRSVGTPFADAVRPTPYLALQSMLDGGAPHGIDIFVNSMTSATTPFAQINGWAVGGAVSRVDPEATAVGDRSPGFEMSVTAGWPPTDPDGARHVAWVRSAWEELRPYGEGVYANFISDDGAAGVSYAYGKHLPRLQALKAVHDPDNFFRMNNNITPAKA
jgi:hypothetical protein